MPRNTSAGEPVQQELHAILGVLQDLLILECARAGMKRDDLRRVVAVDTTRISRIMKHVRWTTKGQVHREQDAT
jgi:hypothetical protein